GPRPSWAALHPPSPIPCRKAIQVSPSPTDKLPEGHLPNPGRRFTLMICINKRAAWAHLIFRFAAGAFAAVNPALPAAPDISLSPANLSFKYQVGSALPASQTLQIKSTGTALAFAMSTTGPLPYSAQWLSLSANSGTTPASVKVTVNPTGLPSG